MNHSWTALCGVAYVGVCAIGRRCREIPRSGRIHRLVALVTVSLAWQPLAANGQPADAAEAGPIPIDLTRYEASAGTKVVKTALGVSVSWAVSPTETAELVLNLRTAGNPPLIERLMLGAKTILQRVQPVTLLTIGERDLRAPAKWIAFFDNPPLRTHRTVAAELRRSSARVTTAGARTIVRIGEVTAGSFRGALEITITRHSSLIFVETVMSTEEDGRAILYDAGLLAPSATGRPMPWADTTVSTYSPLVPGPAWKTFFWLDAEGQLRPAPAELNRVAGPVTVSRRLLVAESDGGALAVFPPPHQYFSPLDSANNLGFVWYGAARNPLMSGYGFGIRQPLEGDRIWVPWINAPPRTEQRLGIFYLLASDAPRAIEEASRFTRDDRYKPLPGYRTFSSHYHIEHTLEFVKAQAVQQTTGIPRGLEVPGFVRTLKARGVDIVHLAEFHVGGMPRMEAPARLALLKTLHEECARLSDGELLVLPGEEPNVHLGGHWMSFFPNPVYWVLNRAKDEPLAEEWPGYGRVYRVGSADDVLQLMERENGLMWTAHPRIKGSQDYPDAYWNTPFFRSDHFLGAAWKAMPADLSQPRLGTRVLDLLDAMANAGLRKYALAEADLFRMETDYESYAHMNINYVKLAELPRFADGWAPLVDALRGGNFFSSTGEVLIPRFTVNGVASGGTAVVADGSQLTVEADLEWTFPLAFAELIWGDGKTVHRQRVEMSDTEAFGKKALRLPMALPNARWIRLEAWDLARNGAFTPPVWLKGR